MRFGLELDVGAGRGILAEAADELAQSLRSSALTIASSAIIRSEPSACGFRPSVLMIAASVDRECEIVSWVSLVKRVRIVSSALAFSAAACSRRVISRRIRSSTKPAAAPTRHVVSQP